MDTFGEEIYTKQLPLLVPCANSLQNIGAHRDKYIPNPSFTSPIQLSMFSFLGKLMGVQLRLKSTFPLKFPPAVWKLLVQQKLSFNDVESIDQICGQSLNVLRNVELEGLTSENFNDIINLSFTTYSCDGREVELVEGGSNVPVTWHNRQEYCKLVEEYKVNEFQRQIDAILKGN